MARVIVKIQRFNPDVDTGPHDETYEIEAEPTDRVLDLLNRIKWDQDGTLTYRRSCGQGICGSDAMRINGRNRLACKILVAKVSQPIVLQPLLGLRVIKDLVVDMDPFFAQYASVMPWLKTGDERPPVKERLQTPAQRARFDDTTKCILCAACTTACPPYWANHRFVGPMALVNAHRFLFDSRDQGTEERVADLNHRFGVWGCREVWNCTEACPRGIKILDAIEEIRRLTLEERF